MSEQWIPARKALEIVGCRRAICARLHAGLIQARAKLIRTKWEEHAQAEIPKKFWWAEGHTALEQDWDAGDFSTWIDTSEQIKVFGVEFALSGLLEMIEFEQRPLIARRFSVAGSPDWIPAKEARRLAYDRFRRNPTTAGNAIVEQSRLGFIGARAVLAQGSFDGHTAGNWSWEEREWDIPTWFWTEFTGADRSSQDWELGRFAGRGSAPDRTRWITLSGVHFHGVSLYSLDPATASVEAPELNRGRKPKYDWPAAVSTCWGRIYRSEPPISSQSDIERLLIEILRAGDDEPGESTVRPYARQIWVEFSKS